MLIRKCVKFQEKYIYPNLARHETLSSDNFEDPYIWNVMANPNINLKNTQNM